MSIIFIGPTGVGKSTQGKLVAKALNMQSLSLDTVANEYYEANNFGSSKLDKTKKEKGHLTAYQLWEPSLAYAAQQVLKDYTNCVIDFGAGHSSYQDKSLFKEVKEALKDYQNIILLLPSPDLNLSVSLLRERSIKNRDTDWIHDGYDFIEHWVKDDCNHNLATFTIYTEGKTPTQTCEEIIETINLKEIKQNKKGVSEKLPFFL